MTKLNRSHIVMFQIIAITSILTIELSQVQSQNVAQWRGINRDGYYAESNLLREWPDEGPELLWYTEELGNGFAAPTVFDSKIFINGETDGVSHLFVFNSDGKLIWKSPNGSEFIGEGFSSNYPGARSTPTIIDDLVYASSGRGRIACYEISDGTEKWAVNMVQDLGGYQNEFGYSESLLVDGNKIFCFPGGTETNIAALDRFTGKLLWKSKAMGDTTSFCSPILISLPNRKIVVTFSRHFLFGLDSENGELLWSYNLEGFKYDGEHCNTPVYDKGYIYNITADEAGKGLVKLELSPDGESIKEMWHNNEINNAFSGFMVIDNNLFTTIKKNYLLSVNLEKGIAVDSVKVKYGSLIFADNMFICYGQSGEVNLINYEQNKFNVTGTFRIEKGTKEHFSHPVLSNGVMYIRHGNALMAYKIK